MFFQKFHNQIVCFLIAKYIFFTKYIYKIHAILLLYLLK